MGEWIIDTRGGICEQCGTEMQSLSLHWSKSDSCSYPELSGSLRDAIRGCLLGDGWLDDANDGPPALRIASVRARHIEWLHEQLLPLSRGVREDTEGVYRLRTMAHPGLGAFWTWQGAPPSDGWVLTPEIARIWYACDGTLEWLKWSSMPRVEWTITDDDKRTAIGMELARLQFEPTEWERRLAISPSTVDRWFDWLGEPSPGSEYKWATSREVYRRQRDAAQHQTINSDRADLPTAEDHC